MATSGSKTIYVTDYTTMTFSWQIQRQFIEENYSSVYWSVKLTDTADGIQSSVGKAWSASINGTTYSGTNSIKVGAGGTTTLATGTTSIPHLDDGTKIFSYSFTQEFAMTYSGEWVGTVKLGAFSGTLDPIPRASQPSCITWPEHTQNVGFFGDTISIHMNRASSSFTHTVRYVFVSAKGNIATGVTTGTTWTIPLTLMSQIPYATSGTGTIYVDTYKGSTLIGTKSCKFTAKVPDSVKPKATLSLTDATGIDKIYGSPVQGLSKIAVKVTPTTYYGAGVRRYEVNIDGVKYTSGEFTTPELTKAGSSPVTALVVDGRYFEATASYTMNVQAYTPPSLTSIAVHRCNEDGTENEQGEFIRVTFSARVTSLGAKNLATYKLRYKRSTDTTYTEIVLTDLANTWTVTDHNRVFAADGSYSYDVEVEVADRHHSDSRSTSASTAFTLINWGADGTSMAFGKIAEKPGTIEIALDVEFTGKVKGAIFDAIYPVGSIYLSYNHTDPSTLFGGTWVRMTDGFLWASRATDIIGQTGGEKTVTLTVEQMPEHNHGGTYTNGGTARTHAWLTSNGSAMGYEAVDIGGGQPHNNMPPYIQVSIWRRTA